VATKADLQRKLTLTTERRAKIAAMVKEGKSLADIKARCPMRRRLVLRHLPAQAAGGRAGAPPAGGPRTAARASWDLVYSELTHKTT
jgi:hypothetical protein